MRSSTIITLLMFCLLLMNFQCDDEDNAQFSTCDFAVVIDNMTYQTIASDFYTLASAEIYGDCLSVNISASGCDASTWMLTLVDSGDIAESMPPQRYLKLTLANNEDCLGVFNKEQSFDLTGLKIDEVNEVLLNIEDFAEPIPYTY